MIDPRAADVGRKVIYRPIVGPPEEGVITSFNPTSIFVRYGRDTGSKATRREDLFWLGK